MATQVGSVIFSISADLKNIQGQLRTLEGNFNTSFGRIEGLAKNFGAGILRGLAAGFSVAAISNFSREILNLADSLQNLSDQTGLSVELLSGFKSPLEEAGTSMDAFAKGVFNLQKNLGNVDSDSDKVAESIKRLGLNLDDLRNSSPDEFIRKVTEALAKIENPVERNTILFNLLGKSAKELGPAFQQLTGRFEEFRAKGLTAADVKALDDVGDALARLKNQALALGAEGAAGLLRFFGIMRDGPKVAAQLAKATEQAAQRFGIPKERIEGMTSKEIIAQAELPSRGADLAGRRFARDELLNLREEFNKLNAINVTKPQAVFRGISTAAKATKSDVNTVKNEVDNFLEGLQKQLTDLEGKKIELEFGTDASLAASLDAQFERFKDNLRDKQLPVPKGLEEFFKSLKDRILAANDELKRMQFELEKLDELGKAFSQDSAEFLNVNEDLAKRDKDREQQIAELKELRQQLQIDLIDTSTTEGKELKRITEIQVEYERTAKRITELGLAAGLSQEEIAADVALAWQSALKEIGTTVNEQAEQWAQAFEGAGNAILDALHDIGSGQNIKDVLTNLARRINDELTRALVTEPLQKWLKQQAQDLAGKLFPQAGAIGTLPGQAGNNQAGISTQQFSTSTTTFSAAVAKFAAAVGAQGGASLGILGAGQPNIQTTPNSLGLPPELPENFDFEGWTFEITEGFGQMGESIQSGIQDMTKTGTSGLNSFFKAFADMLAQGLDSLSTATSTTGSQTGGGGFLGMFGSLFGGGASSAGGDAFAGGATGFEAGFFHKGGEIGPNSPKVQILHGGGAVRPGERLVLARDKEFMINEFSAATIGKRNLEIMNTTGRVPTSGSSGGGPVNITQNFPNASDPDGFRRSMPTYLAQLALAVRKGQKHL